MSIQVALAAAAAATLLSLAAAAAEADFSVAGGELRLRSPGLALAFDERTGALKAIFDRSGLAVGDGARAPVMTGAGPLWRLVRRNDAALDSTLAADPARMRFRHAWDEARGELSLHYEAAEADVTLVVAPGTATADWRATVHMRQGTLLAWEFPAGLAFDGNAVDLLHVPDHLGVAFTREFFASACAGGRRENLGPKGWNHLAGAACEMRPVEDERVALRPGPGAGDWLPAWYLKELATWRLMVNRASKDGQHDTCLVTSEHGPWLTGHRLGGAGWLFRLGGFVQEHDYRPRFASVAATLSKALAAARPNGEAATAAAAPAPLRIAVLDTARPTEAGWFNNGDARQWREDLGRLPIVRERALDVAILRTGAELRQALANPAAWLAIVNPDAETFPAEPADRWREALDGIRDYVRAGGVWWEAGGGYPFYTAIVPSDEDTYTYRASRLFSDFVQLDSRLGRVALYGVQPLEGGRFVCPELSLRVRRRAPETGTLTHAFRVYVPAGGTCPAPVLRLAVGAELPDTLRRYARDNGYGKPLERKIPADRLRVLKQSVLVKLESMPLAEQARLVRTLPAPLLIHTANYLRGGFDKEYPDHLPPNPAVGTADDLKALIAACRERGHLFMPYTNPTWWCTEPRGPTFARCGEAPLARGLDGELLPEAYGPRPARGFTTCLFHPAVREANRDTLRQFTEEYPVDVLFQDQVGARGFVYDANPAAPHPAAYLEGLHAIARDDARRTPLATEDGHDRLINDEVMFCGLSWPWLPNRPGRRVLYGDLWPQAAFRVEPLAAWLAHDSVLFRHHDLGGFVRDRYDLVTSLTFGYGMSCELHRDPANDPAKLRWLERLMRVQREVVSRMDGQPLLAFRYVTPCVTQSRWGDVDLTTNLGATPYAVDASTTLAPEGFHARAPGLDAGIFTRYAGVDRAAEGWWLGE